MPVISVHLPYRLFKALECVRETVLNIRIYSFCQIFKDRITPTNLQVAISFGKIIGGFLFGASNPVGTAGLVFFVTHASDSKHLILLTRHFVFSILQQLKIKVFNQVKILRG